MLNFVHSQDGKQPIKKTIDKYPFDIKEKLYKSIKKHNNLVNIKDINKKQIQNLLKKHKKINLLTYSFPCQDLSTANASKNKTLGMKKETNSRSSLVWEIERILKIFREEKSLPDFLLLENVPAILNKNHHTDYQEWIKTLKNLGYSTVTFKLNSFDYGSIQKRTRVYAISILNYGGTVNNHGEILDIKPPKKNLKNQKIQDILKLDYKNEIYREEAERAQPRRTGSRLKMYNENPKISENSTFIRTLTTRQDRNPNCGVIETKNTLLDNKKRKKENKANFRFLTPREAYLAMGFEEKDFDKVIKNRISIAKLYQQAGNSIVVSTLEKIIKIIDTLFQEENKICL